MHQALIGDDKQREDEAFAFGGEFSFPGMAAHEEIRAPVTLSTLAHLKVRWRMSIASLIQHATRLEIITPRQQRYLYQQLSQRGWRKAEPSSLAVPIERPRGFRTMAELLYGDPPNIKRMASELGLPIALVRNLVAEGASQADMPAVGPVPQAVDPLTYEQPEASVIDFQFHQERRQERTEG